VAEIGRALGLDVVSVHEIDRRGFADQEQLRFAICERRNDRQDGAGSGSSRAALDDDSGDRAVESPRLQVASPLLARFVAPPAGGVATMKGWR
jgi:hypothetical protein